MGETNQIIGKVAGILNERELTINIGEKAGVKVGMAFKVLAEAPIEVRDPETNTLLGHIDREKVKVKASEVFEQFSICRTYEQYYVSGTGLAAFAGISSIYGEPARNEVETLKAEDSSLPPPLSEEESYVKRGDRVISIGN